jgi:hypothetical protein
MSDLHNQIQAALAAFTARPLREASLGFFKTLGYSSQRTVVVPKSAPRAFLDLFAKNAVTGASAPFDQEKALFADWLAADLLFQITDQELSREAALFPETSVSAGQLRSYIFFAVELKDRAYPRGKLANLARQLNRLFPTPVMVLIKHRDLVTLAVINRRPNKLDQTKDVLGRVTLIRDIALAAPHRGHLDILAALTASELEHPEKKPIIDFDTLHAAWEHIFNVELLNKRFYQDLANWYFWALPQVEFPADLESDSEKRRATGLIRLLTRLIFCWFLKEKELIPEKLFHPADLAKILKDFDPESETSSTYYHAILQNLFFATLNQRMGKDGKGQPYRAFAKDEGFVKNKATYDINNLYRYESLFADGPDAALALFADVPFLNGGLFECLDRTEDGTDKKRYLDGFSRNPKKRPHVPDRLFFDSGEVANLAEAYGDKKRKAERVTGLIHILNRYKFTIVENTPIDQEIALDPELLGKVFENLLASYNEETKTTARKQTGSFYTPRPIVDYMVDESLKAHLTRVLVEKAAIIETDARARLDQLFAYTEEPHQFSATEVAVLIAAIDALKILDPACGSGAFPMGVLHKLVYLLTKIDPRNEKWRDIQIQRVEATISVAEKINDATIRNSTVADLRKQIDHIHSAFVENELDYGRKLYLIENCLYGVDIQPVAIQISKLRFFISLVADQKTNRDKAKNYGIRPLPNLETKFVAADTLFSLPIPEKDLFIESLVTPIEKELEEAYHSHFNIQRRDQKLALQKQIKSLRMKLADAIINGLGATRNADITGKARHIAEWDAFDPQASADFFDPHWMFGRSLKDGFDIVTGNPPYQSAIEHKKVRGEEYRNAIKARYATTNGTWDLYIPFFETSLRFLRESGILSFITPNKYLSSSYGLGLREFLPKVSRISSLTDVSHLPVFESASVYPVITVLQKKVKPDIYNICLRLPASRDDEFSSQNYIELLQTSDSLTLLNENLWGFLLSPNLIVLKALLHSCSTLDAVARVCATTTAAEADDLGKTLCVFPCAGWKTLNTGTIDPFSNHWSTQAIRHQKNSIFRPVLPDGPNVSQNRRELYSTPKIIIAKMALRFEGFVDRNGEFAALNCNCISAPESGWTLDALAVVLHSSVVAFAYKQYFDGLRMSGGYLPFQAPQLKTIPIPPVNNTLVRILDTLGRLREVIARLDETQSVSNFLDDVSDACVMECYFREHMKDRELLFHDTLSPYLNEYNPEAGEAQQRVFITQLHSTLNSPSHPIRNRLLRLTADSPDLLAVIKEEGRV